MQNITYSDKTALNENSNIADINKVKASDMNEIKRVVNSNADKTWIVEELTDEELEEYTLVE